MTRVRGEDAGIRNTRGSVPWQLTNRAPVVSLRSEMHLDEELNQPSENT